MKRLIIIICSIFLLVSLIKEVKGFNEEKFKKAFKEVLEDFCKEEEMCDNLSLHEELEVGTHGFALGNFDFIYRYISCMKRSFKNTPYEENIRNWFLENVELEKDEYFVFEKVNPEDIKEILQEVVPENNGKYFIFGVTYTQIESHIMFTLHTLHGKDFQNSRYALIFYKNTNLNCHGWRIVHFM